MAGKFRSQLSSTFNKDGWQDWRLRDEKPWRYAAHQVGNANLAWAQGIVPDNGSMASDSMIHLGTVVIT